MWVKTRSEVRIGVSKTQVVQYSFMYFQTGHNSLDVEMLLEYCKDK